MAGISIQINPGQTQDSSSVSFSGYLQSIISNSTVNSFGLQDGNLKNAVGAYFGQNPNDAYLKSPTPWNDLYSTYGWPQTQVNLVPISASIISFNSQPVIVATQTFVNNSNKTGTFNVSISQEVENTTESNWTITKTIDTTQTINYGISFLGTGGGGSTSLSYSEAWAEGGSQSQTVTLGSTQGVSVELTPGQSVIASLSASKGSMQVQIVYQAYLSGDTAVNYSSPYRGHHFWGLDLPSVMSSGGIANSINTTETISIGFFMNSEIQLTDPSGAPVRTVAGKAADASSLLGR